MVKALLEKDDTNVPSQLFPGAKEGISKIEQFKQVDIKALSKKERDEFIH